MTNDLENLADLFPKIFPKPIPRNHANVDQKALPWGFECGNGWYNVIHDLCVEVMAHCNKTGEPIPEAYQVKEKFGHLRFYIDQGTEGIYNIIDKYEQKSHHTCETCGEPAKTRVDLSWIRTLCDKHYQSYKK